MSKVCPLYGGIVLYLDCLECDDRKECLNGKIRNIRRTKNNDELCKPSKKSNKEKKMEQ